MTDFTPDRKTQIDDIIAKVSQTLQGNQEIDQELLQKLLTAGRNAYLGESTVHTVVHGRREGEEATFSGRIGRGRIGPVLPPGDEDHEPGGPAVQINIWVRR